MSSISPNVNRQPLVNATSGAVIGGAAYTGTAAISGDGSPFITRTCTLPTYTPQSSDSKIVLTLDADYLVDLYNTDEWKVVIKDGAGNTLVDKRQRWYGAGGGGTRSSTLFPVTAVYTNTDTSAKSFTAEISRVSGDDQITMYTHRVATFMEIKS